MIHELAEHSQHGVPHMLRYAMLYFAQSQRTTISAQRKRKKKLVSLLENCPMAFYGIFSDDAKWWGQKAIHTKSII